MILFFSFGLHAPGGSVMEHTRLSYNSLSLSLLFHLCLKTCLIVSTSVLSVVWASAKKWDARQANDIPGISRLSKIWRQMNARRRLFKWTSQQSFLEFMFSNVNVSGFDCQLISLLMKATTKEGEIKFPFQPIDKKKKRYSTAGVLKHLASG